MSRRKAAPKRRILPDPLLKSELLAKFINVLMCNGKKAVAEKITYGALEKIVQRQRGKDNSEESAEEGADEVGKTGGSISTSEGLRKLALELFEDALRALRPSVEVRSRRVGGATYQVPVEVSLERGTALSMRWLVQAAGSRSEKTMDLRLANEILDVMAGRGGAVKKRDTVHSMAKANQAFAHFRW